MTPGMIVFAVIAAFGSGSVVGWLGHYFITGAYSKDEIEAITAMRRGTHHLSKYPGGQKKAGLPRKRSVDVKQAGGATERV